MNNIMLIMLAMLALVFPFIIYDSLTSRKYLLELKEEAINRGYAEYCVTNLANPQPVFLWKEK